MGSGVVPTEEGDGDDGEAEAAWPDVLLDLLLSQLARPADALPSAPLRGAVDALFRVVCHDLRPTGTCRPVHHR